MSTALKYVQGLADRTDFGICPPMMDMLRNKVEGLAFIGLSLTRKQQKQKIDEDVCVDSIHASTTTTISSPAHSGTVTRQSQFDFNEVQDREYKYICSTNDDGWLCGGGEGEGSYKLPCVDSAHCGEWDQSERVNVWRNRYLDVLLFVQSVCLAISWHVWYTLPLTLPLNASLSLM